VGRGCLARPELNQGWPRTFSPGRSPKSGHFRVRIRLPIIPRPLPAAVNPRSPSPFSRDISINFDRRFDRISTEFRRTSKYFDKFRKFDCFPLFPKIHSNSSPAVALAKVGRSLCDGAANRRNSPMPPRKLPPNPSHQSCPGNPGLKDAGEAPMMSGDGNGSAWRPAYPQLCGPLL